MAFKKIKKGVDSVNTNLGQRLVAQTSEDNQPQSTPEASNDELIAKLLEKLLQQSDYNNVTDEAQYTSAGNPMDEQEILALRISNRERTELQRVKIIALKDQYRKVISLNEYTYRYNATGNPTVHRFITGLFGRPIDSEGYVTSPEFLTLKDIERDLALRGRRGILVGGELSEDELVPFGGYFGTDRELTPSDYDIQVVSTGINLIEDGFLSTNGNQPPPIGFGYVNMWDSVLDAEEQNNAVISVLSNVDNNNSYIESLFGRNLDEPLNAELLGRPTNYSLKEIFSKCFDCFLGAWNGPIDFKFQLDIELNIRALLDQLDFLLGRLDFALDIEGQTRANLCSLFNLGVLCPIEIAFLIASLLGLLKFCALEVVMNFRGFLVGLIASILGPLLDALSVAASFGIAPLHLYLGCTFNTLLSVDQVNWTGNWTMSQLVALNDTIRGQTPVQPRSTTQRPPVTQTGTGLGSLDASQLPTWEELLRRAQERLEARTSTNPLRPIPPDQVAAQRESLLGKPAIRQMLSTVSDLARNVGNISHVTVDLENAGIDLLSAFNDKAVAGDGTLLSSIAAMEFVQKMLNSYKWITNALASLRGWASSNSASRIELGAKIIAISTLLSVLIAIYELIRSGNLGELCSKRVNPDGTTTLVPNADEELIFDTINDSPVYILERRPGSSSDPSNPNTPGENIVTNTVTGRSFPLLACQKTGPRVMSDAEIKDIISRL